MVRSIVRVQSISPRPQFNNFSRATVPLSELLFSNVSILILGNGYSSRAHPSMSKLSMTTRHVIRVVKNTVSTYSMTAMTLCP